jgi:hypothetical protein
MPADEINVSPETLLNFFRNIQAAISGLGSLPNIISTLISTTITTVFVPVYAVVEYVLPGKAEIVVVILALFLLYTEFTIAMASVRVAWRIVWGFVRFLFVIALVAAAGLLYYNGLEMDVLRSIERGRVGVRSALDRQEL